jgi:hypothetical protein
LTRLYWSALWQLLKLFEVIPGGGPTDVSALLYLLGAGSIFSLLRLKRDDRIRNTMATVIALDCLGRSDGLTEPEDD